MGFGFRKSFKMGPMHLNVSKSGIGTSDGTVAIISVIISTMIAGFIFHPIFIVTVLVSVIAIFHKVTEKKLIKQMASYEENINAEILGKNFENVKTIFNEILERKLPFRITTPVFANSYEFFLRSATENFYLNDIFEELIFIYKSNILLEQYNSLCDMFLETLLSRLANERNDEKITVAKKIIDLIYVDEDAKHNAIGRIDGEEIVDNKLAGKVEKTSSNSDIAEKEKMQYALSLISEAIMILNEAENSYTDARIWGIGDILGGKTLFNFAKHYNVGNGDAAMTQLNGILTALKDTLKTVNIPSEYKESIGFFTTFADFVFDGVVMDVFVQTRIHNSLAQIKMIRSRLEILQKTFGNGTWS